MLSDIKQRTMTVLILSCLIFFSCEKENPEPTETFSIQASAVPEVGGTIAILNAETNAAFEDISAIPKGTKIIVEAKAAEGFTFLNWEGGIRGNNPKMTFPISQNIEARALFRGGTNGGSPVAKFGKLSVTNSRMVDSYGVPVQLRGMSLFWSQWIGKYWNANVVKWLAEDWEINIIRAAMGADESDGWIQKPEVEQKKVETVVDAAINKGIYVIIDWHSHHAENHQADAIKFFKAMAQKYGEYPNVIYEIYNEPLAISWSSTLKPYAEAVVSAIREIDPDNIIVVGTPNWSQDLNVAVDNPISGTNIMYGFHFYASEKAHYDNLRKKLTDAIEAKLPVMVTEWGVSEASGNGDFNKDWVADWIKILEDNNLTWCNWSVADKAETSAALMPGANSNGNWKSSELSPSGTYIRSVLRAHTGYSNPQ